MATYTKITKPSGTSYTSQNPIGKQQYDQSTLQYDDSSTFYDGANMNQYTNIVKPANSSITVDSLASKIANGFSASPTFTWNHTITLGCSILVLTAMTWQDVAGSGTIASATFNGQPITAVSSTRQGSMYSWVGYILNPSVGTNIVSVTVLGNIDAFKSGSISLFGTATSTVVDVSTTNIGNGATISNSITTTGPRDIVISSVSHFDTNSLTIGDGQSSIYNDVTGSTGGAGGYILTTSSGIQSPLWATSGTDDWSIVSVGFKANQTNLYTRVAKPT